MELRGEWTAAWVTSMNESTFSLDKSRQISLPQPTGSVGRGFSGILLDNSRKVISTGQPFSSGESGSPCVVKGDVFCNNNVPPNDGHSLNIKRQVGVLGLDSPGPSLDNGRQLGAAKPIDGGDGHTYFRELSTNARGAAEAEVNCTPVFVDPKFLPLHPIP